ncbi:helical backbone metal receptor [Schleiferia thermophila]|jgi:ABC-type Fe3+-hydroxamate transport system substrate-binding protein|uniref:helical backbone metal receptor n=1 Tax=Schleiferia thermophila TaxID=884107 RepID=UPI0004E7A641|nr:helical backbone metal receptor [Schleiferia thermophila]KFD39120.1 iron ABC transporter [Schleiferia thermophila str. Yellowstone]
MRIVSLVPSLTEYLYHLKADVVGITKFCIHPEEWYHTKPRVGGTKNPDLDKIKALKPDLVIANREENRKEDIEHLKRDVHVLLTDIVTLEDAYRNLYHIGEAVGKSAEAEAILAEIKHCWEGLKHCLPPWRTLYLIWKRPYMAAGRNTYIHHVMEHVGLVNVVKEERYPKLSTEQIIELEPELVLLSSEPYPFKDKHIEEFQAMVPKSAIRLVDGEAFSWYGYRMIPGAAYIYLLKKELKQNNRNF